MAQNQDLSAREKEVMALMLEFGHVKKVAASLGLSPRTIEAHLANVRQKLGVQTTVQAVAVFLKREPGRATEPVKSNRGPRRWRWALTCATVLLVVLSVPDKDEPNYSELREAAISAGGVDWFTDEFEATVKLASATEDGSASHPFFANTTIQVPGETVVDVVSAPGGRSGSAVKFVDTSWTGACLITYDLWRPYRRLFIDWYQYLDSDEDVLQMSVPGWLIVTAIPERSLYADHPGIAVTDRSGASMSAGPRAGTWYHVAVMIDVAEGKAHVWVDDRLIATGLAPIGDTGTPKEVIFSTGGMTKTPNGGFVASYRFLGVRSSLP